MIRKIKLLISKYKMKKWIKKNPNKIPIVEAKKCGDYNIK